jgi:hypothetical protein
MQTGLDILGYSTRLQAFKLIAEGKTRYLMIEKNKSLNDTNNLESNVII